MRWLDRELDGQGYLSRARTSRVADICALSTIDFAHWIGLVGHPGRLRRLKAWHERVTARPSAAAESTSGEDLVSFRPSPIRPW